MATKPQAAGMSRDLCPYFLKVSHRASDYVHAYSGICTGCGATVQAVVHLRGRMGADPSRIGQAIVAGDYEGWSR